MLKKLRLVDRAALAYMAAMVVLMAATSHVVDGLWPRIGLHLVVIAGVLGIVRIDTGTGPRGALRAGYSLPLLLFWWGQLEVQIPLLWGSYWATDWAVRADLLLFGGAFPTMAVQRFHSPWLDELMVASYLSYYLFLAVPLVLVARSRYDAAIAAYGAIVLTYVANFSMFILFPAKSPPQILGEYPGLEASGFTGVVLGDVVRALQASDSVTGAAFPSSHVAGSMVCTLVALRFLPRLGRVLAVLLALMSVATVYLGYHHAVDPLAGIALGWAAYRVACRYEPTLCTGKRNP